MNLSLGWVGMAIGVALSVAAGGMDGPLRLASGNARYFTDKSGKAIYLAGTHTWNNLVEMGPADAPVTFGFERYLDLLKAHHHNFFRLWTWQHAVSTWDVRHQVAPLAWARTGPGPALDGRPRFDLSRFDPEYFERLRTRVQLAGERGIYASVMLFEGWGLQFNPEPWKGHPFNAANNVNGIDGDPNHSGKGLETQSWEPPAGVWEIQRAYLRKVIDTVNEFDNVLYEVVNEAGPYSTFWQYQVINFVKGYEAEKPKRHPVGMTFQYEGGSNQDLFNSPADWISPNPTGGYRDEPPAADGRKVIVNDTDHLWGIGGDRSWVWKSFCRGHNVLFMDPYTDIKEGGGIYTSGNIVKNALTPAALEDIRAALGRTRDWSERLPLTKLTPQPALASSGYCLARTGGEEVQLLVYVPKGPGVSVDLTSVKGRAEVEWYHPGTGVSTPGQPVKGGRQVALRAPFGGDALVYVRSVTGKK